MEYIFPAVSVLILSAFFSGSEIAFLSVGKIDIELRRKSEGRRSRTLASFFDQPERFITNLLVGNNVVLVLFALFMSRIFDPVFSHFLPGSGLVLLANTIVTTLVVLIFGEYLPKVFFGAYSYRALFVFTWPLFIFKLLFAFPTWILSGISNFILKYILRIKVSEKHQAFTRLDLEHFVDSRARHSDEAMETELFRNALHLKTIKVRECMIPRTEVVHVDIQSTIEEVIACFHETNLSRILVTENEIDNVLGYIHHLQFLDPPTEIRNRLYDLPFVPESMNAQEVLLRFMKDGVNIACVVDEFGGVSGIITLEDLLEEIFGEIEDEHDVEEYVETRLNDRELLLSGRLEIDYLNEKYEEIELPSGEYTTLSGYIVLTRESIPEEGEEIELDGNRFVIVQVSDKKIETVRMILREA